MPKRNEFSKYGFDSDKPRKSVLQEAQMIMDEILDYKV